MNTDMNKSDNQDDMVLNYTYKDVNLAYSHEPIIRDGFRDGRGERKDVVGTRDGQDGKDGKDMRSNRVVRNAEIPEKEIRNENMAKNSFMLSAMMWISNTVSLLIISFFVTLIVTKNGTWFYILLSIFIIITVTQIVKIILMRYDAKFLYRPSQCIGERMTLDALLNNNFILKGIFEKIDNSEYFKRGFPSMYMTTAVGAISLVYLFFPKYRKSLVMTAPLYIILVGYSHIYLGCHTILQLICGVLFGVLGAKVMYNIFG